MLNNHKELFNEFMFSEFSNYVEDCDTSRPFLYFKLNDKYGKGYIKLYELISGVYLSWQNYEDIKTFINVDGKKYIKPVINIQHYIAGKMRINLNNGISAYVKPGDSLFYSGDGDIVDAYTENGNTEMLTLFCYLESLSNLNEFYDFDLKSINSYIKTLQNRKEILVSKTDSSTSLIIRDLLKYIDEDNIPMIKLRGIELYFSAINGYAKYEQRAEVKYQKELIDRIVTIKDFIEKNWSRNYTIMELSEIFNISQTYIKNVFKYVYDVGPAGYIRKYRLEKAKKMIEQTDLSIIDISNTIGYSNSGKFSRAFKEEFGILPIHYRKVHHS